MTDQERIERLEKAVACLADNLTRAFPLRAHHCHTAELIAITDAVRASDQALEADARRRLLENELAELSVER